ncbi:lipopolysaccharide biosynthesis protein [Roseateles sp.]|uniref:lipopolysaccharide biosynthesis protein n=1 Tax=Roseateles sp. TaxID=1971397 RepID=UPI0039EC5D17
MSGDLVNKSVTAAKWGVISTAAKFVLQLAVNVVIARLLGPDSYGLFALCTLVLMLATLFSDFGLGWSLMQRQDITDEQVRFVSTWQTLSGLFGTLALVGAAPLIASFLHDPRLVDVVRWLALTCVLNGMASTASNLLRREMRFKDLAKVQLLSYTLAYGVVGLPAAALGAGVWALVAAWVVQALLGALLSWRVRPHAWRPKLRIERPREFVDVGATVLVTNVCNWALTNMDRLILGRVAGTQAAGHYAVGYNLATVPNGLLISALQPAFLASGARLQDDLPRMAKAYLEVQSFIWIVLAPLFVLLAVSGEQLIQVLYGKAWNSSGPVFMWLALAMPAYLGWALSTPVLWNTGRKHMESLLQLPLLLLGLVVMLWAASQSIEYMAASAGVLFLLRYAAAAVPAGRALPLPLSSVWQLVLRAVAVCAAVALPGLMVQALLAPCIEQVWLLGVLKAAACLLPWLLLVLVWPGLLGRPALSLLKRFMPKGAVFGRVWATPHS